LTTGGRGCFAFGRTPTPSGQTGRNEVRRTLARALRAQVDDLRTDALGNLIAFKKGSGAEPRLKVMVDAHTDEWARSSRASRRTGSSAFNLSAVSMTVSNQGDDRRRKRSRRHPRAAVHLISKE
jgi:hypothetical protein